VAVVAVGAHMTEIVVVGTLLVQALWNLTAATYLLRGVKLVANPARSPSAA
jgi:hypothetical protein